MSKLCPVPVQSDIQKKVRQWSQGFAECYAGSTQFSPGQLFLVCWQLERMLDQGFWRINIVMRAKIELDTVRFFRISGSVSLCLLRHVANGRTTHGPFLHLVISLQEACYVINTRFSILDFSLQYVAAWQPFIPKAFIRTHRQRTASQKPLS